VSGREEIEMTDTVQAENSRRFRSPPYPSISLNKAIERTRELYSKALHHSVGVAVLSDAWGYGTKSSGLWATAAALLHFNLLSDEGTGDKRKFKITEAAIRIVRDADPNSAKRREAIERSALTPKIFAELWARFGTSPEVSDMVLKSYLTLDRGENGEATYSDNAADAVLDVYKQTIAFAGLQSGPNITHDQKDKSGPKNELLTPQNRANVGDYVQWTSNGQDQFKPPRRVVWVSDDGSYVRVHGSKTGIPMAELTVVEPPKPLASASSTHSADDRVPKADISVLQVGNRLEITANVDAAGLEKLKELLSHYEQILKLLK
jgi:hypothetical protein